MGLAIAKGIVEGRNAIPAEEVSSPTFTLIHQYGDADGPQAPVYHIDLYRLDEAREVESLGLDDLFASGSLVLLEWAAVYLRNERGARLITGASHPLLEDATPSPAAGQAGPR